MADNTRPPPYQSHDLDFEPTFEAACNLVSTDSARNFAVYFNQARASGALNLDKDGLLG